MALREAIDSVPAKRVAILTTLRIRFRRMAVAMLLSLQIGGPASGSQTKLMITGTGHTFLHPGTTGARAQDEGATVSTSGKAGGEETSWLGGKRRPLYRLTRSDVIAIDFSLSPEYDQQVTIQPDGFVTLKDAGAIYAQGLTLDEFRTAVFDAYRGYLHDPKISIALKDFARPYFVAGGELVRPGKYDLRSETTVMEAVEIAGGFTERAKHSQVVLFRRMDADRFEAKLLNLKKMLAQKDLTENPQLQAGDVVYVPQNTFSKIAPFLSRPGVGMYLSPTQF